MSPTLTSVGLLNLSTFHAGDRKRGWRTSGELKKPETRYCCSLTVKEGTNEKQSSGQSYKASTIVIYDSRVIRDWKIPHITTLES